MNHGSYKSEFAAIAKVQPPRTVEDSCIESNELPLQTEPNAFFLRWLDDWKQDIEARKSS